MGTPEEDLCPKLPPSLIAFRRRTGRIGLKKLSGLWLGSELFESRDKQVREPVVLEQSKGLFFRPLRLSMRLIRS